MKFDVKPLLIAALGASFAFAANAQPAPAGSSMPTPLSPPLTEGAPLQQMQPQSQMQQMQQPPMHGADAVTRTERHVEHMQVRIAEHLAGLKVKLDLTPAQQGAWQAFDSAATPSREQLTRMVQMRASMRSMTTPERIDRLREVRSERAAAMDRVFDATRQFYAQLSPEQQKTFDQNALPRHGQRGHRSGRGDWKQ